MTTKICAKCLLPFQQRQKIEEKIHNLQNRKFCLLCSQFKHHNTRDITKPKSKRDYNHMTIDEKTKYNKRTGINIKNRRRRKLELIKLLGGGCKVCGYNKNWAVLQFHHKNPSEKWFNLSVNNIAAKPWEDLFKEVKKCDLLCSNCHAELHYPHCEIVRPDGTAPSPTN